MSSQEVQVLLRNPNPLERALALKLDSVSPEDVALAILDPDSIVWKAALSHPNSQHAIDVLSSASRDASGDPLTAQHDALLADPRCTEEHVANIHRAISNDGFLPIHEQTARLKLLKLRLPLKKTEEGQIRLDHYDDPLEKEVKSSQEEKRHSELKQIYDKGVNSNNPIPVQDSDLHDTGNASPKVTYKINDGIASHHFLVKPYLEAESPLSGWNESTSQELYHAAEIPHLHQKSFVSSYRNGGHHVIPATVIHIEDATPIHKIPKQEILAKNPKAEEDARKIALMDFLTGNGDRHSNNLMIKPDGQLLAIDHGLSFSYAGGGWDTTEENYTPSKKRSTHLGKYTRRATSLLTSTALPGEPYGLEGNSLDYHKVIKHWWPSVSPDIKRTFQKRLELIQNPALKRHLESAFNARHKWLDEEAQKEPEAFLEDLKKAVEDPYAKFNTQHSVIEKPPQSAKNYDSVNKELLTAHPKQLQLKVDQFEKYINHPDNPIRPEKGDINGIEQKALVKHADKNYLLKAASTPWNPLSGWSELTSQAMYHAGGIGHLHQDSHLTNLNIKEGGATRQQPAIAIHFRPGKWRTLSEVKRKGKPGEAKDFTVNNDADLKKAYLMDFLTGNSDRHDENVLVGPNGEPQMIDHSFSFKKDDWSDPEDQDRLPWDIKGNGIDPFDWSSFSNDHGFGTRADKLTHDWWKLYKKPIVGAFNTHLDMIPDKEERTRRKAMFDYRVNALDKKHPLLFEQLKKSEGLAKGAMQRLFPFDPAKESQIPTGPSTTMDYDLDHWTGDEDLAARKRIAASTSSGLIQRSLQKLHSLTSVRRGPNGREFLLHRGHNGSEAKVKRSPTHFNENSVSSWTPKLAIANQFSRATRSGDGSVTSAWVPEQSIKGYVPQFGSENPNTRSGSGESTWKREQEVIVGPGKFELHNAVEKTEFLEKGAMSKFPFNPQSPGTPETYAQPLNDWVDDAKPKAREQLGLIGMEPNARARSLHKLHANTEVRRNPKTSEREFLLHRCFGDSQLATLKTPGKYNSTAPRVDKSPKRRAINYTSWSADPNSTYQGRHVVSAWVPESHISFYIPQYNNMPGVNERAKFLSGKEKEVIVQPGEFDIFHQGGENDWKLGLDQKLKGLHKSLGNAEFLHDQHTAFPTQQGLQANMKGVHEKLLGAHPSVVNPHVRAFEIAVNQSKAPIAPFKQQKELNGLEPKALYKHNGKSYLVKAANEPSTAMGGFNEMTSQAVYHAGNIGHLHQKAHATIAKTGLNRSEPAHAIVIHMEPDSLTLNEAAGWTDEKGKEYPAMDYSRVEKTMSNPEHLRSLQKIGMMDFLLSNIDRHASNLLVKPDGSVIAIDHGRSLYAMRKHALGRETSSDLYGTDANGKEMDHEPGYLSDPGYQDSYTKKYMDAPEESIAAKFGGEPEDSTWDWWHDNKGAMLSKFRDHVNMLPDEEVRQKMLNGFMSKYHLLDKFSQNRHLQDKANSVPLEGAKTLVDKTHLANGDIK